MVFKEGVSVTDISYHCTSSFFLSVVTTMNEQVVPSAVVHRTIVKFLTNENVKPAEILMRLRAQSFKECRTEVEIMRRLRLLQGKLRPTSFGNKGSYSSIFW